MAVPRQQSDHSQTGSPKTLKREIFLPEGYELAFFTLRSLCDGQLHSYQPLNASVTPVQAIPIAAQLSGIEILEMPQEVHQASQSDIDSYSLSPPPSSDNSPCPSQTTKQHIDVMPLSGSRQNPISPYNNTRELSVSTLRRHAHERDTEYTDVCGVASPAISTPVKKYNHGKGEFCCPRCRSNFTRPKSVKDHFPSCISKCGNPQALRFTDHPSMAQTEAAIRRRARASRETSSVRMDRDDSQMDDHSQEIGFEEMHEALARTSLRVTQEHRLAHDGMYIKTESMSDADIPRESIEPTSSYAGHHLLQSTSSRGQVYVAQTPDWQNPRLNSSTPTPHSNPWNVGVPGSAAEHAKMDMRATAPFDGWLHESQTPEPTNRDGTQDDGLDNFMDRRSHISPTPAASHHPERMGVLFEEVEMEE